MPSFRNHAPWLSGFALLSRLGRVALFAMALNCSGCAWFKATTTTPETTDNNFRQDPKENRIRPKRENGNHNYGTLSPEAQEIERSLGI